MKSKLPLMYSHAELSTYNLSDCFKMAVLPYYNLYLNSAVALCITVTNFYILGESNVEYMLFTFNISY